MSGLSRRTMFKGSLAMAGVAGISTTSRGRITRAQDAASFEIVSFGPITEGALAEGYYLPQFGAMVGMNGQGFAFGNVATSVEKLTPALFAADGALTKLKSGTFGAEILAVNSSGNAAGISYDTIDGRGDRFATLGQPVAWFDGEFVRLPVPDPERETADLVGMARMISDDGVVFGDGNGHRLLWRDGEPEILPTQDAFGNSVSYYGMRPDGGLVVRVYDFSTEASTFGISAGGEIDPFEFSDVFDASDSPGLTDVNSAGELLMYDWQIEPTGVMYASNIVAPGQAPVVIDTRGEGIAFRADAFNADHVVVGTMQERAGADNVPAIWEAGELTSFETLLPADHGYHGLVINGISDDGVISGSGWDKDGGFHPLLFVPA